MTNEQKQVKDWMLAFGQECPEKPTIPSLEIRKLRAKLILEEAIETIEALGFQITMVDFISGIRDTFDRGYNEFVLQDALSEGEEIVLKDIADGCEDLKVVTDGTLVACGLVQNNARFPFVETPDLNKDPLFNEVMRSNNSKMWSEDDFQTYGPNNFDVTCNGCKAFSSHCSCTIVAPDVKKWIVRNSTGKVIKSPSYSPPNLQPIIDEMNK